MMNNKSNRTNTLVPSLFLILLAVHRTSSFSPLPSFHTSKTLNVLQSSSNVDLFSGGGREQVASITNEGQSFLSGLSKQFLEEQASLLRKEAEELEISMREEARAKGIPEEMINKLIPIRGKKSSSAASSSVAATTTAAAATVTSEEDRPRSVAPATSTKEAVSYRQSTVDELRSKIGYLNIGDAVSFSTSLNRLKSSGYLRLWDSVDLLEERFSASVGDLKFKTSIEPVSLKLDDVGYNYQNVLVSAVIIGTVCALLSSTVGGQIGFLLGYVSVLFPIAVVGVGSFAPALIGELLLQFKLKVDPEARQRYVRMNAGKFLVGYILGLPVYGFNSGDSGNTSEFFQLRPGAVKEELGSKRMFSKSSYTQHDVAPSTVASIAGSVAECMAYGAASGSNAVDVNLMYELLTSVDPALPPEKMQSHIRWSAVTAYNILNKNRDVYQKLVSAFSERRSLEDCIAIVEGSE